MKICFICGFLEQGKSGVGDYIVRLAKKLVELNHECTLIAIHDPYITSQVETYIFENKIKIFRLPQNCNWSIKTKILKKYIKEESPDIMSLQYVSYSFANRGFTFKLAPTLRKIAENIPWHLMVHETWIGEKQNANIKEKIIGFIQKIFFKKMFSSISPIITHTSNTTYQKCLSSLKIKSSILPMFSTIKVKANPNQSEFYELIKKFNIEIDLNNRGEYVIFCMFGIIFPNWPPEPLLTRINNYCKQNNKKGVLLCVGNVGSGNELLKKIIFQNQNKFKIAVIGEQPNNVISNILHNIDYGIAVTPLQLLGKSTAAAAFLEHGVPLIVNRFEKYSEGDDKIYFHDYVISLNDNFNKNIKKKKKFKPDEKINFVAHQFINDISKALSC